MYDAKNQTQATQAECDAAVGKRGSITFTGTFIEAQVSPAGNFVRFELDERFGMAPGTVFGMDLEAST